MDDLGWYRRYCTVWRRRVQGGVAASYGYGHRISHLPHRTIDTSQAYDGRWRRNRNVKASLLYGVAQERRVMHGKSKAGAASVALADTGSATKVDCRRRLKDHC